MQTSQDRWFLLGDLHGEAAPIDLFYWDNRDRLNLDDGNNHIILLGDVGANFGLKGLRDQRFKKALSQYPFTSICLRGNHEARVQNVINGNPRGWKQEHKYGGTIYVEKKYPKIEYLSDVPAVYEFAGYKTLSIPGAYSVDKWYRLSHKWTWFADEQLTEEEMELGRVLKKTEAPFDLVISHTCPWFYMPTDLFLPGLDQSTVDNTMERYLGELEYDLDYKRWAWGHYHADRLYPWVDGKEKLMLFNEKVVDLRKFMEMRETGTLREILA